MSFKFSVCHPTARIDEKSPLWWYHSMCAFRERCDKPKDVEYILAVHMSNWERFQDGLRCTGLVEATLECFGWGSFLAVRNTGANTGTAQGNKAGSMATGQIIVGSMDDLFPPEHWDTLIWQVLADTAHGGVNYPAVLHVSSGSPGDNRTFIPQIFTKKRYDQFGYAAHPSYISMYSDNEFSEVAERDGVVVEAPHIVFDHRHPSLGKGQWDDVYAKQNAPESYSADYLNFLARKREGFPKDPNWRRKEGAENTVQSNRPAVGQQTPSDLYTDGRGNFSRRKTLNCQIPTTQEHLANSMKAANPSPSNPPLFSILHTSSRPEQWAKVHHDWIDKAIHPEYVEYIACFDQRWGFNEIHAHSAVHSRNVKVVWNEYPYKYSGYVSGVNRAAAASTGQILIVVADDQFACEGWDDKVRTAAARACDELNTGAFVIQVSTNTVNEHERGIFVMPILSRARYERLGYVFYPAYESMYADNDLCEQARREDVVIDARHLVFPHSHPLIPIESGQLDPKGELGQEHLKRTWDKSYQAQHQDGAYQLGKAVLELRRENGFSDLKCSRCMALWGQPHFATCTETGNVGKIVPAGIATPEGRPSRTIAWCLPFQQCSAGWFTSAISLYHHMHLRGFNVVVQVGQSPACHVSREGIRLGIFEQERNSIRVGMIPEGGKIDYLLWQDSDNLMTPRDFDLLLEDLETHRDLMSVGGWYRMTPTPGEPTQTCCAQITADGLEMIAEADLLSASGLVESAWYGLGGVLMRREILNLAGDKPFAPLPAPNSPWGVTGEDTAFFMRARKAGAKIAIDPRVFLPHMKLGEVGPRPVFKSLRSDTVKLSVQTIAEHESNCSSDKSSSNYPQANPPTCGESQVIDSSKKGKSPKNNPRVIACLRVKNEGRWIRRVLHSIAELCEEVLIIDNGSTDNTLAEIARARPDLHAGGEERRVTLLQAKDNDEGNDRQRLLDIARSHGADYILNLDGDEELEECGAKRLFAAIRDYPGADAYYLEVHYLWNRPDLVRVDGWYQHTRFPRLFRVTSNLHFESISNGIHTRFSGVQLIHDPFVKLWHYGYMLPTDRLAKYEHYSRVDPNNIAEDCYRHMVIGDVPELPATARTRKAGPLDLRPVLNGPRWTAEEFDQVCGKRTATQPKTWEDLEVALL